LAQSVKAFGSFVWYVRPFSIFYAIYPLNFERDVSIANMKAFSMSFSFHWNKFSSLALRFFASWEKSVASSPST
jgi:hypothetical protein